MAKKKTFDIIFEDEHIVVLNKAPGMLTLSDRYAPDKASLHAYLQNKFGEIFTVHRLDKETSGVILFAKNAAAHRAFSMMFEHRNIQKYYLTVLDGQLYQEEITVDKPIASSLTQKNKMVINARGKESKSIFRVLESFKKFTLVEVEILSGRTHQIRIHAESIGYPLSVDAIYGVRTDLKASDIKGRKFKSKAEKEERPLIARSILHANRLCFTHPFTKEKHNIVAELPKDFRAVLSQLRKWNAVDVG